MQKITNKIMAVLLVISFSPTDIKSGQDVFRAKRSPKVARFDFMCAIEAGDVWAVNQCLDEGLDINERWGQDKDTPLMFAIKKLAAEKENHENIMWKALATVLNTSALAGLCCVGWQSKDWLHAHILGRATTERSAAIIGYIPSFKEKPLETVRERWQESVLYSVGPIIGIGVVTFLITSLLKNSQKMSSYLYYRWKISRSRLEIIEKLINHSSVDLSVRNEIKNREGKGQTALDMVRELQQKEHSAYINDLLHIVEMMLQEKLNPAAPASTPLSIEQTQSA